MTLIDKRNYQGIANTIVQLFPIQASGVMFPSRPPFLFYERHCRRFVAANIGPLLLMQWVRIPFGTVLFLAAK